MLGLTDAWYHVVNANIKILIGKVIIMKKHAFRFTAIILACFMAAIVFAGCTQTSISNSPGTTATKENLTTDSETNNSSSQEDSNFNKTGYPIVKDKITFTCMQRTLDGALPYNDMVVIKKMEELTNIHIEWQPVSSSSDFATKLNLALAADTIPDFIVGTQTHDMIYNYGVLGDSFYEISDLIYEYMPNLTHWFNEYPEIKPAITMVDGSIYGLPYIFDTTTASGKTVFVRMDMLEKTGHELPTTIDEFYDVLVALDNYNFSDNFVPLLPQGNQLLGGGLADFLFPSFGEYLTIGFDVDNNGKVIYTTITEQFRRYVEYIAKLYTEGLIEQDIFTMDYNSIIAKIRADDCAVVTLGTQWDIETNFKSSGKYDVEMLAPLTSQYSSVQKIPADSHFGGILGTINSKCKNIEALLRWIDVFYTTEDDLGNGIGVYSSYWGIQGEHWKWLNAEKSAVDFLVPDEMASLAEGLIYADFRSKYITNWALHAVVQPTVTQFATPALTMKAEQTVKKLWPYMKEAFPDSYIRMLDDELKEYNEISSNISRYSSDQLTKFVTGAEPINYDSWNNYISQLEKMGIKDMIAIKQTAYDRYLKVNKK